MIDRERSVHIKGRVVKRTRRSITLIALDKQDRTRTVIIPTQYVRLECKLAGVEEWMFAVPAWQAFQNKLTWSEV